MCYSRRILEISMPILSEFKTIGAYTQATYKEYLEQHSNEETFVEICKFKLKGVHCPYLSIKKGLEAVWGEGAPKRGLAHLWGIDD